MDELKKFAINEAKDYLSDLNYSIQRTREKCWQLLIFKFGVSFYLLQRVAFEGQNTECIFKILCFVSVFITGVVFYHLRKSVLPSENYRLNGDTGKNFKMFLDKKIDLYNEAIENYTKSIDKNKTTLKELSQSYRNAFNAILTFFFIGLFFTIIFLVMF